MAKTELVTLEDTMTGYYLAHPMHFHRAYGYEPTGFNGGRRMPVEIHDDIVLLRGTSKAEEAEGREYLMRELCPADFERRLQLPEAVNAAKAEATIENGLLTLRLPFAEEAKPKTIKVRAG
jgi:HSP20 family protein